mmetsp:Transcript_4476/g.20073  ORF Transcript_4476/g.20073 Transcript_4476/m.20073 type:complete len:282 (-) Transcript_4476:754-1599(-)
MSSFVFQCFTRLGKSTTHSAGWMQHVVTHAGTFSRPSSIQGSISSPGAASPHAQSMQLPLGSIMFIMSSAVMVFPTSAGESSASARRTASSRRLPILSLHLARRASSSLASSTNSSWGTRPFSREVPMSRISLSASKLVSVNRSASRVSTFEHPARSRNTRHDLPSLRLRHTLAACSIVDVLISVQSLSSRHSRFSPHTSRSLHTAESVSLLQPARHTRCTLAKAPSSRTMLSSRRSVRKEACADMSSVCHTPGCRTSFRNLVDTAESARSCLGDPLASAT